MQQILNVRTWFAVALVWYFALSFLAILRRAMGYDWVLFALDSLEVVVIVAAFSQLGFVDATKVTSTFRTFYLILALAPILHFLWNRHQAKKIGKINWRLPVMNATRLAILVCAATVGGNSVFIAWLTLVGLVMTTVWYTIYKRRIGELAV